MVQDRNGRGHRSKGTGSAGGQFDETARTPSGVMLTVIAPRAPIDEMGGVELPDRMPFDEAELDRLVGVQASRSLVDCTERDQQDAWASIVELARTTDLQAWRPLARHAIYQSATADGYSSYSLRYHAVADFASEQCGRHIEAAGRYRYCPACSPYYTAGEDIRRDHTGDYGPRPTCICDQHVGS